MRITYTAPNRAHHYPLASALSRLNTLHAFVSGFSRFSPRANLPEVGNKLKRKDFFQNLYIASLKLNSPNAVINYLNFLANNNLDRESYQWAKRSDVFIYYRTAGNKTALRLKRENLPVLNVMEEVNSHVDICNDLMKQEYEKLGVGKYTYRSADHDLRIKSYNDADYILCPSKFVKESFLQKGFCEKKIITFNYGFPDVLSNPHTEAKGGDAPFRLLYVGQLHYRKGLRYAIEAFKKLRHPKKEFIIVGNKTTTTGLEGIDIPKQIIFTGPLKGSALSEQYKKASVFVLPSVEDGFGLVVGEALSYGLPVIISSNCGACDVITDGTEGFIIPPFDSSVLTHRLQLLADQPNTVHEMSISALKTAKSLANWDETALLLTNKLEFLVEN